MELAAALTAEEARGVADDALARLTRERGKRSIRCGWTRLAIGPGGLVRVPGDTGLWRVAARTVDRDGVGFELRRVRSGSMPTLASEPGRSLAAPDQVHGSTVVHLLDLPNLADSAPDFPQLYIAAAGASAGWRRASLLTSLDDGANWSAIGWTAPQVILGTAQTALAAAGEALLDEAHHVDLALLHEGMLLEDADDARLLAGANLALLGDELVQFGRAEPLGGGQWRVSRLLRGRRGTEWAAVSHVAGERFVLLEAGTLLPYAPPLSAAGGTVRLLASGIGDPAPVETSAVGIGEALRPPAPVQLTARCRDDGGFDLTWIRSSRTGWPWLDETDAPLGEDREAYRLSIRPGAGEERVYDLDSPAFDYSPAALAADAASASSVRFSVVQIGSRAISRPAVLTLSL